MLIHATTALLPDGWAKNVAVEIEEGRIVSVRAGAAAAGHPVGCLLPAPVNLHSHTFQRAMAGLTETRTAGQDSFWTWRSLMYRFLDRLTPDDVQAIAAQAMLEMAQAGFAAVAEFHYLHHAPGGQRYGDLAEMSGRIVAAAGETGLGLTLLPVLYQRGGCDGRAPGPGQQRFAATPDQFAGLWQAARAAMAGAPGDCRIGVAPHSLRAVDAAGLEACLALAPDGPVHIHVAEQLAEVTEVRAHMGARPVEWLLHRMPVDARWCLIHATQMAPHETTDLAASGAVAGLCPITEANLGDGIFDGARYLAAGGRFGLGSDSNVRISLTEEMRMLEYSQRLGQRARAVLARPGASTGRVILQGAVEGGAQAAGRASGAIREGLWADLVALRGDGDLAGRSGDTILDSWIFAAGDGQVSDLWSAGRHLISDGRHARATAITERFRGVMARLGQAL